MGMSTTKALLLLGAFCQVLNVLAKPLNLSPQPQLQRSPFSSSFSNINQYLASNITSLRIGAPGTYQIECDGDRYGQNPDIRDCEGARLNIEPDSKQYTFGERQTGLPGDTFPLPWISMGGAYNDTTCRGYEAEIEIDRALCYFQPIVIGEGPTGKASFNQIRSAASALALRCAASTPSSGGIVRNFGTFSYISELSAEANRTRTST